MVELTGEATHGLDRVLEMAAGTDLVTPAVAAGARAVVATDCSAAMVATLEQRVGQVRADKARTTCD